MSALVALALLTAPCLSVVGPIGLGKAFAYHSDQIRGQAAAHQQRFVAHDHAMHGAAQPAAPATDFAGCCCACDGWISKSVINQTVSGKRVQGSPAADNAKALLISALVQPAGSPPDRWHPSGVAFDPTGRKNAPLYAFTGRVRL